MGFQNRYWVIIFLLISPMLFLGLEFNSPTDMPFIVGLTADPGKFDPLNAFDTDSMNIVRQVCEGLYMSNYSSDELEPIPCLAKSMGTWSNNNLYLTIELKQGVTFHNGFKFNSSAVKWNFDRLQYWTWGFDVDEDGDLENNYLGTASMDLFQRNGTAILNHTEILDEYTIRFILNFPCMKWENLLAFVATSIVLPDPDYSYGSTFGNRIDLNDELIGTGPFKLTEYTIDEEYIFDYNPDYHINWGEDHIERMIYKIIPDPDVLSQALIGHEVSWGEVEPDYEYQLEADPSLISISTKRPILYYIRMNPDNVPFSVRQASQWCWNYSHTTFETLDGEHYIQHVPIPDGMQYHHPEFEGIPSMNIAKAREYILNTTDSGLAANVTISGLSPLSSDAEWISIAESSSPLGLYNFTCYSFGFEKTFAEQIQDNLKLVGIRLKIKYFWYWPPPWQGDPNYHNKLSFTFGGFGAEYNEPSSMIENEFHSNRSIDSYWDEFYRFSDPYLDSLIDITYNSSGIERRDIFYEIQEYFVTEIVPAFFILQLGTEISFNWEDVRDFENLLNIMGDWYWLNVELSIRRPYTLYNYDPQIMVILVSILSFFGIAVIVSASIQFYKQLQIYKMHKTNDELCSSCNRPIINRKSKKFCPFCGSEQNFEHLEGNKKNE